MTPLLNPRPHPSLQDTGLLLLRLGTGLTLAVAHGWPKLLRYPARSATFADPLGVGSELSMAFAIFGELVCGIAIAAGFLTRLSAVPVAITMAVAYFVVHSGDPFRDRELALMFLTGAVVLTLTGPGRFSLDSLFLKQRS